MTTHIQLKGLVSPTKWGDYFIKLFNALRDISCVPFNPISKWTTKQNKTKLCASQRNIVVLRQFSYCLFYVRQSVFVVCLRSDDTSLGVLIMTYSIGLCSECLWILLHPFTIRLKEKFEQSWVSNVVPLSLESYAITTTPGLLPCPQRYALKGNLTARTASHIFFLFDLDFLVLGAL